MTKAAKRLLDAAKEAVAVAKGEQPAASVTVQGHRYYPLPDLDTSTRIALRRFAEEEGISLEEAVVRLVRDGLVGLGMVEPVLEPSAATERAMKEAFDAIFSGGRGVGVLLFDENGEARHIPPEEFFGRDE